MKTTLLFLFCFFCAGAAFGQSGAGYGALSNEPQVLQMPSHPQHATQKAMASEQSLLETSVLIYARGQRPLWDFAKLSEPIPLGDAARALRKERAAAKKARVYWQN
jgi:hypothetical protein